MGLERSDLLVPILLAFYAFWHMAFFDLALQNIPIIFLFGLFRFGLILHTQKKAGKMKIRKNR